jgi:CrcB protein
MAQAYFYVCLGAIFGAATRFFFTHLSSEWSHHHGFPYGTLFVNVTGSLVTGLVLAWTADRAHLSDYWRLLLVTGFCGAYTTFSTFSYESVMYLKEGRLAMFALNLLSNNILCLAAVLAGVYAAGVRQFQS